MRQRALTFLSAALISLATFATPAAAATGDEVRTARAEVSVLPQPDVQASKDASARGIDDLRDCAALVLVGSMLIGLAAAVRRTA